MVKANENRVDHWVELVIDDSLNAGDSPNQFGADCELMISILQEHVDAVKRVDLVSRMDLGDVTVVQA
tara:strand:+ start:38120 stop:38323 length:204 start_codon:yes stop_codon:yes gene_type:complete